MPETELQEMLALTLVFVVHVIGGLLLVWALLEEDTRSGWRRFRPRPPGFGGGGDDPPPPGPRPTPPAPKVVRPPLPLADADPSPVRLRGPRRLADAHPPAPRRPDHAPEPARAPR